MVKMYCSPMARPLGMKALLETSESQEERLSVQRSGRVEGRQTAIDIPSPLGRGGWGDGWRVLHFLLPFFTCAPGVEPCRSSRRSTLSNTTARSKPSGELA